MRTPDPKLRDDEPESTFRGLIEAFDDLLRLIRNASTVAAPIADEHQAPAACCVPAEWGGMRGILAFVPIHCHHELTPRQLEVACLLIRGRSNSEIALALGISENSVSSHIRRIYDRLGVSSRVELATRMFRAVVATEP
jgi:DNA-binding CsgD family transcriptional regulator